MTYYGEQARQYKRYWRKKNSTRARQNDARRAYLEDACAKWVRYYHPDVYRRLRIEARIRYPFEKEEETKCQTTKLVEAGMEQLLVR